MNLTGRNILVTGGAGFIGSHLVDRIIREEPTLICVIDDFSLGSKANLEYANQHFKDVKVICQDASDYRAMKTICEKQQIEIVFNLAVVPLPASLIEPLPNIRTNLLITLVLCELQRLGVFKRLFHFSSSEAYGDAQYIPMDEKHPLFPTTPYAASKAACDHTVSAYCKVFGTDAIIIRPFNTFGERQNDKEYAGVIPTVIRKALQNETIEIFGDGNQTRDFLYVQDLVDAVVDICRIDGIKYSLLNIASGKEVKINDLIAMILKLLNRQDIPIVHRENRPGDIKRHCGGIELAGNLIGFKPSTSLGEGIKKTVDWYVGKP